WAPAAGPARGSRGAPRASGAAKRSPSRRRARPPRRERRIAASSLPPREPLARRAAGREDEGEDARPERHEGAPDEHAAVEVGVREPLGDLRPRHDRALASEEREIRREEVRSY